MRIKPFAAIGAIALAAIAFWPAMHYHIHPAQASIPVAVWTMAPVTPDYRTRDYVVGFWERRVRNDPNDQISASMLSHQYLQRYRETGDIGDVLRAETTARQSLRAQSFGNTNAQYALSAALLTFHRFQAALDVLHGVVPGGKVSGEILASKRAGLDMELGRYVDAERELEQIHPAGHDSAATDTVLARYDELTGHLARARKLLQRAQEQQDSMFDAPAEARAWYHEREGEMAFHAGDMPQALQDERDALAIFPNFSLADNALARFALANHDPKTAYQAAAAGAAIVPLPETLGYEADAAAMLGNRAKARQIRDLIFTIEKIGNVYHTSDRLLAVYYSEHRLWPDDALHIAQRDVAVRGDEIYAQDTLAWAAAMAGKWDLARRAIIKATRRHTEDALLDFHEGVIAMHFGERDTARRALREALRLNPHFHPYYADQARKMLE